MSMEQDHPVLTELQKLMPKTSEEFLNVIKSSESDVLDQAVLCLLTELAETILLKKKYDKCLKTSDILIDFIWEKLNTGYWRDVNISWRYAYTLVSMMKMFSQVGLFLKDKRKVSFADIMKTCDMGLLMGAPLLDNILAKMSSCVSKLNRPEHQCSLESTDRQQNKDECPELKRQKLDKECDPLLNLDMSKEIVRCHCPSLETFKSNFLSIHNPVIITNAISYWPAMTSRRWSLKYIKEVAGSRTVPIELGSKYTEESWSQKLMTISEFIENYFESTNESSAVTKGYLAQHQLFDQIPELQNDISVPSYCCLGEKDDVDVNAWFGPKGTVSPLHYDDKENLLTQVLGCKYIRIYSEQYTDNVYPHPHRLLHNTSQVDIENPDHEKFPLFKTSPYLECILNPGEMLYIPAKHWHFVKSLSISFSVSFWWE